MACVSHIASLLTTSVHVVDEIELTDLKTPRAIGLARVLLVNRAVFARGRPLNGTHRDLRRMLIEAEIRPCRRRQRSALANEVQADPTPPIWLPHMLLDGPVALPIWFDQRWIGGPSGPCRVPSYTEGEALGDSAAFY